ncbi:tyrosine-protein phosphatase [Sporolactobacillus sp. THM19-2]|uniref:tyrosine-protein phosphatase n=1 Tax=Sporolactobacillus sp. THM19-2 TaxID=2511171 RepID=UPI0010212849|nr:tyrosine-protein phosphatase [Sporolactobacillus sp. THM19-2]RYL92586.1 tyrosine-protein phosphatase [Sporolactobacillus sp. THM19-2]
MPSRRILLSGTLNTRDLGGYPAEEGRVTRFGRVIRSDAPLMFTADDITLLKQAGVTAAIDFRSKKEIMKKPSAFAQTPGFHYFHCPFVIGNQDPGSKAGVPPLYARIIADFPAMRQIFKIITREKGAVLIHCAAGKDRTGVVSALLLLAAGVPVSDILADYQISYTYLRTRIIEQLKRDPQLPAYFGRSDMEYMEMTLDQFFKTFGDIGKYLTTIGLTGEEKQLLKQKLFLPSTMG